MSIFSKIIGSTGNYLRVNSEGAVHTILHTHPPSDETIFTAPFSRFFTDDGLTTGSSNMIVDGSVTPVDFYIPADNEYDIYIKTVSVALGDNGANLSLFGALAALTNGVEFTHNTSDLGTTTIDGGITTNLEFVRLAGGQPAFGTGVNSFKADINGGGQDTYLPVIDFAKMFGNPWGLRLRKNSTDNLKFTVRDALAGLDQFDIRAFGVKIKDQG